MKWFIGALVFINVLLYGWVELGRPNLAELYVLVSEKISSDRGGQEVAVAEPAVEDTLEEAQVDVEELGVEIVEETMGLESASLSEQEEIKLAVQEYWETMFREKRDFTSPAERVALLREMRFLFRLGEEDSKYYWDILQTIPDEFAEDKKIIGEIIIQNIALDSPTEAMAMLVETGAVLDYQTYEDVVRIWMEEEGASIMEWFDSVDGLEDNPGFADAFMKVYSEEDPLSFVVDYGNHFRGGQLLNEAVGSMYLEMGTDAFDAIAEVNTNLHVLEKSFGVIVRASGREDPFATVDWVNANRNRVSPEVLTRALSNLVRPVGQNELQPTDPLIVRMSDLNLPWRSKSRVTLVLPPLRYSEPSNEASATVGDEGLEVTQEPLAELSDSELVGDVNQEGQPETSPEG